MMILVLALAFPRENAGANFFQQYDGPGDHTLNCSPSATKRGAAYVWYGGRGSSLQRFEQLGGAQNQISTPQCEGGSCATGRTLRTQKDGIFACTLESNNHAYPIFSNNTQRCSPFDFFFVAIRSRTEEAKAFGNISQRSESVLTIPEQDTFSLACELRIKNHSAEVSLYWFKETAPSRCLFSASMEGNHFRNFSYDVNCCVDTAVRQRQPAPSISYQGEWLRHNLTIANASLSDGGTYLCVVAVWALKRVWTIARNVSVEVENSTSSRGLPTDDGTGRRETSDTPTNELADSRTKELQISLGLIGVVLIGGIIGVLYWKKKAKGNPVQERPRNRTEMALEEDECTPYAVSSWKDADRNNENTYSLVTYPPEPQPAASTLSDGQPGSQPREKVHTVYALLSK